MNYTNSSVSTVSWKTFCSDLRTRLQLITEMTNNRSNTCSSTLPVWSHKQQLICQPGSHAGQYRKATITHVQLRGLRMGTILISVKGSVFADGCRDLRPSSAWQTAHSSNSSWQESYRSAAAADMQIQHHSAQLGLDRLRSAVNVCILHHLKNQGSKCGKTWVYDTWQICVPQKGVINWLTHLQAFQKNLTFLTLVNNSLNSNMRYFLINNQEQQTSVLKIEFWFSFFFTLLLFSSWLNHNIILDLSIFRTTQEELLQKAKKKTRIQVQRGSFISAAELRATICRFQHHYGIKSCFTGEKCQCFQIR